MEQTEIPAPRSARRGFTAVEIAVCVAMLAALLTLLGKSIVAVDGHMRQLDDRVQAMRTVENMLERLLLHSWDAISEEQIHALELPQELLERWPDAELDGSVTELTEPVVAKRVTLRLSTTRNRERSVSLTTWIYRAPES